ncbi:MAG: ATP-binding protein [Candidatus Aminicenantes bacterium]|nr:MAG: ATP-binding protein [Candidatus Aminicenantes bacterium]
MKFYDRVQELELLRKTRRAAVVGRRRIGKTRLLEEAMSRDFIYLFFYSDASEAFIAEKWTTAIKQKEIYIPPLNKITDILEYIFRNIDLPMVIDEIQNASKKFPGFISLLQQLMDTFKTRAVYITGSLISVMKKIVENYKSPIFGRFDFIIKLRELDFQTVLEIMSDLGYSWEEALKYYSVFGGIPKYYELIETLKPEDFNDFINLMFFRYPRPLYNEIYVMLKEEIGKDFSNYFGILHAASQRGVTFNAIASAMNMLSTSVSKYLTALIDDYQLMRREQPVSKKKKKTHYFISSNIIDFWFKFGFSQQDQLDRGNDELVHKEFLKHFPTFFGFKFENMVIQLLPSFLKRHGIDYRTIGKDWGKDYEFDFVVENENNIYIGEIKRGELNVTAEIDKIDSITRREAYYRNKTVKYIFIANKFFNIMASDKIIMVPLDQYFQRSNVHQKHRNGKRQFSRGRT